MTVEFRAVNNPTTWRRDKFDLKFARTLGKDAIYSEKRRFRPFLLLGRPPGGEAAAAAAA